MEARINEIATGIYRLSPFVPKIAAPVGFIFNQLLILGDAPPASDCGHRRMFPLIVAAVARVIPPEGLRWISSGHIEANECGAINEWPRIAPRAIITNGAAAARVWLNDMADRPPQILGNGEVADLGGKRVRYLDTPHVPHGWEAGALCEETTETLWCGDLFTHTGNGPVVVTTDVVGPSMATADMFGFNRLTPATGPTIRQLAALAPAPRH
jgi:flavorubredoxin